uniref:Reverse transcriptase domain-containing protein n=1 Tax=Oreochromis niloticus TaxID=8128 RepID=A0A669DGC5_ORENI
MKGCSSRERWRSRSSQGWTKCERVRARWRWGSCSSWRWRRHTRVFSSRERWRNFLGRRRSPFQGSLFDLGPRSRRELLDLGSPASPLLFSLYTNCCTSTHQSVKLIKFADDTTVIGLISDGDESAYRREVEHLVSWCSHNNLVLNAQKTVEIIVDFRKHTAPLLPIILTDTLITSVDSFRFLGTTITQDLKWEPTITSVIKKAQQRMYFLRQLKKFNLSTWTMMQFYTAIIESILTSSITVWYAGATIRDKQRLQRVVRSAEKVIGCRLPSLQDLYTSRTLGHAARITADLSHPGHSLFDLLPSGRRLRSICTRTSRHKNSFFPSAIGLMNNNHMTVPTTNT